MLAVPVAGDFAGLQSWLEFKGPVWFGLFAFFGRTKDWTGLDQSKPVTTSLFDLKNQLMKYITNHLY